MWRPEQALFRRRRSAGRVPALQVFGGRRAPPKLLVDSDFETREPPAELRASPAGPEGGLPRETWFIYKMGMMAGAGRFLLGCLSPTRRLLLFILGRLPLGSPRAATPQPWYLGSTPPRGRDTGKHLVLPSGSSPTWSRLAISTAPRHTRSFADGERSSPAQTSSTRVAPPHRAQC